MKRSILPTTFLVGLALGLAACSPTQVVTGVEVAISATSAALTTLNAASPGLLTPTQLADTRACLATTSTSLEQMAATLSKGGPSTSIALAITAELLPAVQCSLALEAELPSSSPVVGAIQAVTVDLEALLTQYGEPPTTTIVALSRPAPAPAPARPPGTYHFTGSLLRRLQAAQARAEQLHQELLP